MRTKTEIVSRLENSRSLLRSVGDWKWDNATELSYWIAALEWVLGGEIEKKSPLEEEFPSLPGSAQKGPTE